MQLTGKEDLRVQKTMTAIDQAFDELIQEADYSQITVTELCRRARINKKTFYHYYRDLDDLLEERQREVADACLQNIDQYRIPEDLEDLLRAQFYVFQSRNGLNGKIICSRGRDRSYFEKVHRETKEKYWDAALQNIPCSEQSKEMISWYIQMSMAAFYQNWIADGARENLDEVIHTAAGLICSGVNSFLQAE